jgi:electron transport complex protein RnfA
LLYGLGAGLGFWLALVVLACQRERLEAADPPAAWRGAPLALVSAGLTAMALLGLAGVGNA